MLEVVALILGSWLIFSCVAYWCWCSIRVWLLRQRLYVIRGEMFDLALERQAFGHPHYVKMREAMNKMIRIAPLLSLSTMRRLIAESPAIEPALKPQGEQELEFVTRYVTRFAVEVVRFSLFWTASGWFSLLRTFINQLSVAAVRAVAAASANDVRRVMRSPAINVADDIKYVHCGTV
jgi:hypothetical protein